MLFPRRKQFYVSPNRVIYKHVGFQIIERKIYSPLATRVKTNMCSSIYVSNSLKWDVVVPFLDIGGIVDHHCSNFIFIILANCIKLSNSRITSSNFQNNINIGLGAKNMVFNTTYNNISAISWQSVLLVEKTGVPG